MKNLLITPFLFINKYKKIVFGINQEWYSFAENNGFNLIIANNLKELKEILKLDIRGLILSGGNDVVSVKNNKINSIRELNEIKIINYVISKKIPIIGICRGFQLFSKLNGSKLINVKNHQNCNHRIFVKKNKLINNKSISTNSFHRIGIKKLNNEFEIIGKTRDENIEIVINKKKNFLGLMFHPERKNIDQKPINILIKKFIS
tara:strand:- start:244 stop:855 length:612 start_codon:yes stop_codon:yes gene_type:complete